MINRPIVYLSFDRFPSAKGAATHINAFATALGEQFGNVSLITIPSEERSRTQSLSPEMPFPHPAKADYGLRFAFPTLGGTGSQALSAPRCG